jgi:predicted O-methyltransferase YrrM
MSDQSFSELQAAMRGFQESRVLLTAVELDVFTAVGAGAAAAEVAASVGTDPRATEILLNALVSVGALTKTKGVFRNTAETARYLDARSPDCARTALMHTAGMFHSWATLTDCVRAGTAAIAPRVERDDPQWTRSFIAAMHRGAEGTAAELVRAVGVEGVGRMLDVGGGSGAYSIAFAQASPSLRAEIFDLEFVLPIAQEHIQEAGLADRITTRAGDLRIDEFGSGFDLVLLSSICHMLDPDENRDLLRRCFRALTPGGRIAIRDFVVGPDRTAPRQAALFAINMLVATRAGSTYTEAEYESWLREGGFRGFRRLDPAGDLMVASRPGDK